MPDGKVLVAGGYNANGGKGTWAATASRLVRKRSRWPRSLRRAF
nr:hypothetical protein [Hyalangium versicolor]